MQRILEDWIWLNFLKFFVLSTLQRNRKLLGLLHLLRNHTLGLSCDKRVLIVLDLFVNLVLKHLIILSSIVNCILWWFVLIHGHKLWWYTIMILFWEHILLNKITLWNGSNLLKLRIHLSLHNFLVNEIMELRKLLALDLCILGHDPFFDESFLLLLRWF